MGQSWMHEWILTGSGDERELREWLDEKLPSFLISGRAMDKARRQAEVWIERGIWAALRKHPGARMVQTCSCAGILFGIGNMVAAKSWVGIFNSRKHRIITPNEDWLDALRAFLPHIVSHGAGIASSIGTLTYDLVTLYAQYAASRLLLVWPFPIEQMDAPGLLRLPHDFVRPDLVLTCQTKAIRCAKRVRMVCRDRILALLADVHLILEIRSGGNLLPILQEQQEELPRDLWIFNPSRKTGDNTGNLRLLGASSEWSRPFSLQRVQDHPPATMEGTHSVPRILWQEYLYHYTRSCRGAWPGQSYVEYLMSLLDGDPNAGHTALDTLLRMLREGRIRAGSTLVRGGEAVICWTSKSPLELASIRKFNPALIRWTFEPYGIAVSRSRLREEGAKPAIYGNDTVYSKLEASERFRFQLHRPPDCSWKHEKEWRTRGDLVLEGLSEQDAFLFVPHTEEGERLKRDAGCTLPVIVLHPVH